MELVLELGELVWGLDPSDLEQGTPEQYLMLMKIEYVVSALRRRMSDLKLARDGAP